ncbi:MAG TPA: GatB/YqeY domain-containing protein [Candidatus Eisenbacteria bacterium]|nr:GatB/YqeY domain-containing protein [Candidatus Eisenbacteria bacterium]
MPLTEEGLGADLTAAMKARDMPRVYVLRGLITAAKNLKVERRGAALAEADLVQLVRKEMRKREEAEEFATKAGRTDVVEQNRAERQLLEVYVPALLAPEELERIVRAIAGELPSPTIGAVMSALRERHAGRFDGKLASDVARRVIAGAGGA